ncbi:MAG: DNA-directed RNA polymerase [Candidatus Aenigmatarchaeota archaeon]|nr:DNA-directed RNA polymerase [Candidatus Aenigmarchaeota archaeon]
MYRLVKIKTKVKVPPTRFNMPLNQAIKESISETYEGYLDRRYGIGLVVTSIDDIGEGKIVPEDPSIHYPVTFEILTFKPELHEVVSGDVIDNTEFGAFVRVGPMDGLAHVSQLLDDFVSYDEKNSIFSGKETKRTLKEGDSVIARVISVNLGGGKESKIGLTMRQPGLGAVHWIEEEKKAAAKAAKK